MEIDIENIRLHRDDDDKEQSFYWNILTGEKVDENLIPFGTYTPEMQYTHTP